MRNIKSLISKYKNLLLDEYIRAKRHYIKYYDKLPIDGHAVLLESEHGRKIDGNIYYILKYLLNSEKYNTYSFYVTCWGERRIEEFSTLFTETELEKIIFVVLSSKEYFRVLASAKYLINDTTFGFYFIKKQGQIYLNTWHGTPLKTLGRSVHNRATAIGNVQRNFVYSDYLLYANDFTKQHMIEDYMLQNIYQGKTVLAGYPRNEVFFDINMELRRELDLECKRIYAYMPTYRGAHEVGGNARNNAYLLYYLYELDKMLADDEILYVNLHPLAQKTADFSKFVHIKNFPEEMETYEFLSISDVLITDYSSVFFDFACTKKKIVLFTYDKDLYLADRGMYFSMDELPFPQVGSLEGLLKEIRSPKDYDDTAFIEKFCPYDNAHASQQLCDYVILGEETGVIVDSVVGNGKENVLIYSGNLSKNGITTSLAALMHSVDVSKRNYFLTFGQSRAGGNSTQLKLFPKEVSFFPLAEYFNLTFIDSVVRKLSYHHILPAGFYTHFLKKRLEQNINRAYGGAHFDTLIQFNGYENDVILLYTAFKGKKSIYVHNDMLHEIKMRGNQRRDVLHTAYNIYDKVAAVTRDVIPSIKKISGRKDNICIVNNTINYQYILDQGNLPIQFDDFTKFSVPIEDIECALQDNRYKYINIGRFSPEKGHDRLIDAFSRIHAKNTDTSLYIMGGNSYKDGWQKTLEKVYEMHLEDCVYLLLNVANPYAVLNACDSFVLSSFYEGFGLVLIEADILGKPVISTDIVGPRLFMQEHGGTLVENSEDGIYDGMMRLLNGEVKTMSVDYETYNKNCVEQFENNLF